jgi:hypothetical protein
MLRKNSSRGFTVNGAEFDRQSMRQMMGEASVRLAEKAKEKMTWRYISVEDLF